MTIKIGDKEYSDEEAIAIIQKQEELGKQLGGLKPISDMIEQYGVSPEQFANETRSAFGALLKLQDEGVLDKEGKYIPPKQTQNQNQQQQQQKQNQNQNQNQSGTLDVESVAQKALEHINPTIQKLTKQNELLQSSLNRLYREKVMDVAKGKDLDVTDEDVSISFAQAGQTGKDFWEILQGRADHNKGVKQTAIESFAKEHGLDIKELNARKEIGSDEGKVAAAITEGTELSLRSGEGKITPREATEQLFSHGKG